MPDANHLIDNALQAVDEAVDKPCALVPEAHAAVLSEGHLQVQDLQPDGHLPAPTANATAQDLPDPMKWGTIADPPDRQSNSVTFEKEGGQHLLD